MTGPLLATGALGAFLLGAIVPLTGQTHPTSVEYGGETFDVEYDAHVWLARDGERVRDLGYGQQLLRYDFDGDGAPDLGVFSDERDGFRSTFAYLEIWSDDGRTLADAVPVSAKWKDGHWVWIDVESYPALDGRTLWGWLFESFMREQDRAHSSWF
jgi:hypothetical protein